MAKGSTLFSMVRYDDACDVLYLSVDRPSRDHASDEGPLGLVWRVDSAGKAHGVTVLDFHALWGSRQKELIGELSSHFGFPPSSLKQVMANIHF